MNEETKYQEAWKNGTERNSRTAWPFAKYIESLKPSRKVLDLGCGNGLVVSYLRSKGIEAYGVDITLEGLRSPAKDYFHDLPEEFERKPEWFYTAPLWDLPFEDYTFDWTISCDVLEHIPTNHVDRAIKEILRVTHLSTFHVIATFPHLDFHPTVWLIRQWEERFYLFPSISRITLVSRKDFLREQTGYIEKAGY